MKRLLLICASVLFTLFAKAQTSEELAVQKACEAETRAWLTEDAETFNKCWAVRPYTRILVTTEDGQTLAIGSDQLKAAQKGAMGTGGTFENTNYLIRIDGNLAVATYDEVKIDKDGLQHPSHEMRILEKEDGTWKLVSMSVHHFKPK